jgi:hypothetical protein
LEEEAMRRIPFRSLSIALALAAGFSLAAQAQDLTEEQGVNRRGSDYSSFDARDVRECKSACDRDSRCEAYAFNNLKSICYLKNQVPPAERDSAVTSGVKRGSGGSGSGRFTEEWDVAYRGDDYSKFLSRDQDACQRECRRDDRCAAYTFNRQTGMCFLKNRVGRSERDRNTVSGVKGGGSGGRPGPGSGYGGGNLTEEWNLAYRGVDYTDFRSENLEGCKDACRRDRRCVGYTYNHRSDVCYLKDRLGRAERDDNAISGIKGGSGGGRPRSGYDDLTEEPGVNRPGGDYSTFRLDNAGACKDECRRDNRCRAYAYNTRTRECFLKDREPRTERGSDVVSGVKEGY